jgi:hypothetical protein
MAAGRETPRQKMIGMMYLVLTALLALNITKEVVNAFVTINDKLDASATIINSKIEDDYLAFDMKKISILAKGGDLQRFTVWKTKADSLKIETKRLVSFLLSNQFYRTLTIPNCGRNCHGGWTYTGRKDKSGWNIRRKCENDFIPCLWQKSDYYLCL